MVPSITGAAPPNQVTAGKHQVAFALLALALSAVGLYGVISYGVNQRTTEIGIRMAVGAEPKHVLKLILREGLVLAVVGTLLGAGGALVLTRFLSSVLFGVSATDPTIYLSAAALLLVVVIAACFWPARKASAVQPLDVVLPFLIHLTIVCPSASLVRSLRTSLYGVMRVLYPGLSSTRISLDPDASVRGLF